MSGTVSTILTIIGVIAGLIVMAASTVAFFRANLARQQIVDLRGDRDDEKARGDRLDRELGEERAMRVALEKKVTVLERVVTGKEQLEHIETLLINHDRRVDERHDQIYKALTKLTDSNEALVETNQGLTAAFIEHTQRNRP